MSPTNFIEKTIENSAGGNCFHISVSQHLSHFYPEDKEQLTPSLVRSEIADTVQKKWDIYGREGGYFQGEANEPGFFVGKTREEFIEYLKKDGTWAGTTSIAASTLAFSKYIDCISIHTYSEGKRGETKYFERGSFTEKS